jgi:hypothetical protein
MGVGGQRHAAAVLPPGMTGWGPGSVSMGEENLAPTRIWSPECPARNESLYHHNYAIPAPTFSVTYLNLSIQASEFFTKLSQ